MKHLKSNVIDYKDVIIKWQNDESKDWFLDKLFEWYRNDLDLGFKSVD